MSQNNNNDMANNTLTFEEIVEILEEMSAKFESESSQKELDFDGP